jgi:thioredoxin reductase (NADPH)
MSESVQLMQNLVSKGLIETLIPYSLKQINGDKNSGLIQSIVIEDLDGGEKTVDVQYLLAFFGLTTDFGPLKNCGLEFDGLQIKVEPSTMQTNLENVFAVGDACTYKNKLKLILTGFAEVATAVHKIKEIVFPGQVFNFEYSTSTFAKK